MNLDPRTPLTNEEAYLAYKAGIIDEIPPRIKPMTRYQAYLAMWCGQTRDRTPTQPYTREEAYVATLAGVPNVLPDTARTRLQAYYEHIIKGDTPIPDYPITREEYYLSILTKITSGPVSFEPNIRLETDESKIFGLNIYGNTEQVKTSGKNILKLFGGGMSNGINSSVADDGTVTYSGTVNGSWANISSYLVFDSPLPAGTYSISINYPRTHRVIFKYRMSNNVFSEVIVNMTATSTTNTFTTPLPIIVGYLYVAAINGTKINDTVKVQLEYGSTATPYEPYTGGVTNLYDAASGLPVTVGGLTLKQKDGMLECTGATTEDNVRFQEKNISDILENNNAYTIYADTTTADLRLTVRLKRKDNNSYEYYNTINSQTATFTWNTAVYSEAYIYLVTGEKAFWNGSNSVLSRFGLFKGKSFDGNNYAPVGMNAPTFGEIKGVNNINIFSQGKNLFDTRFGERVVNGVNIKTYSDGSFELDGTPTIGFSLVNIFNSKSFIPSGKYKLKIEHLGGSVEKVWSGAYFIYTIPIQRDTSKQPYQAVLKPEHLNNSSNEFTITVNDTLEEYYVPFVWVPYHIETSEAFWNYKNLRLRITLVKEGENTDFTEFESSNISANLPTLYKVGNYQDYITIRNDKWYIVRNVGEKRLNGSENWIKTPEKKSVFICENIINSTGNYVDGYCTHSDNSKSYPQEDKQFAIRGDGKNLCFLNMATTSITAFKDWLSSEAAKNNPVRVFYPLSSPTEEEITDPALLTELKKLMEMRTYRDVTNISITSTNGVTPELSIKYLPKGATDIR